MASDLVGEIHSQAKKARARRLRNLAIAVVILIILAVIGWFAINRVRTANAVDAAATRLAGETMQELAEALESIDAAGAIGGETEEIAGARALALARLAVIWNQDIEAARSTAAAAPDRGDGAVARALLLLHDGADDAALAVIDGLSPTPNQLAPSQVAWVKGLAALSRPHDTKRTAAALAGVEAELKKSPASMLHARLAAALLLRSGKSDDALDRIEALKEKHPTHLGLVVDEAFVYGVTGQNSGGVISATEQLLESEALSPGDRARARLARGAAHAHEGEREEATADLSAAWNKLPAWDWDARDRAVAQLRWLGDGKTLREWTDAIAPPESMARIYEATALLLSGNAPAALDSLAEQPQGAPEVAYLQALALVEQRRFAEAGPWIERASASFPERVELAVAGARVAANAAAEDTAIGKTALETLEAIEQDHPGTPRLWTALGEARAAAGDAAGSRKAFETAREREPAPAEASHRLGMLLRDEAIENPALGNEAAEALADAARHNPHIAAYSIAHAMMLRHVGRVKEAGEVLTHVLELPGATAEVPVTLIQMELHGLPKPGKKTRARVEGWIARARELGADEATLAMEEGRLLVASGEMAEARARLEPLVATRPADVDLRLLYVRALAATEGTEAAIENLRAGVRRSGRKKNGRLFVLWGELERTGGRKQQQKAASLANDGWDRVRNEDDLPAREVFAAAEVTMELWLQVKREAMARRVGYHLTREIPLYPEAFRYRARLERRTDHLAKSCELSRRGVLLPNANAEMWAERAACFAAKGSFDDARNAYDEAIKRSAGAEKKGYERAKAKL